MRKAVHLFGRALRETGQKLDRFALEATGNEIFNETFSRHRSVMNLFDRYPVIAAGGFIAPSASVIGKVLLYDRVSIWYGAVLRGDKSTIKLGQMTNVQDRAVISTVTTLDNGYPSDVVIGDKVTIGHGALITSCTIGNHVLVGQGAIIQEGCDIGDEVIIAAGSVVLPNMVVPSGQLWAGNPAKYIRDLVDEEKEGIVTSAETYDDLAEQHAGEFLPFGTVYQEAEKVGATK